MYELTCPNCKKDDTYWEPEGMINCYVPLICEHCNEFFYILHRSWFDPLYDTSNVEVRTVAWIKKKRKKLKWVGKYDDGEQKASIYYPKWDIYKKFGGKKKAERFIRNFWDIKDKKDEQKQKAKDQE